MEKQLNSSGKFFTGFPSFSILVKIQDDLETRRIQPEEFTDRIIFMSMFNDIVWNANGDTLCFKCRKSPGIRSKEIVSWKLD